MTDEDQHLIDKATRLLTECKLSGPSVELCERIVSEGFADDGIFIPEYEWEREQMDTGIEQRRKLRELCQLHGV